MYTLSLHDALPIFPLFYISMGPMIGLPVPAIIDPDTNSINFATLQLILTVPVVGVNWRYYTDGFRALFKRRPNMNSLIALGTSAAFVYSLTAIVIVWTGSEDYVL